MFGLEFLQPLPSSLCARQGRRRLLLKRSARLGVKRHVLALLQIDVLHGLHGGLPFLEDARADARENVRSRRLL